MIEIYEQIDDGSELGGVVLAGQVAGHAKVSAGKSIIHGQVVGNLFVSQGASVDLFGQVCGNVENFGEVNLFGEILGEINNFEHGILNKHAGSQIGSNLGSSR